MIYNKYGLFLVKVTWFIWKLVFHIYRDYKDAQSPRYFLWCNEEPEVGHAEKTDSRNLFVL